MSQFGRADAVDDVDAESLLPGFADMGGQRLAGRETESQPARHIFRLAFGIGQHGGIKRGHREKHRRLVSTQRLEHGLRRRPLRIEHRGGADRHWAQHGVAEAIGEEQLGRGINHVVFPDAEAALSRGARDVHRRRMHMHRSLRHSGRAGRIEPVGDLIGGGSGRCRAFILGRQQHVEPRHRRRARRRRRQFP